VWSHVSPLIVLFVCCPCSVVVLCFPCFVFVVVCLLWFFFLYVCVCSSGRVCIVCAKTSPQVNEMLQTHIHTHTYVYIYIYMYICIYILYNILRRGLTSASGFAGGVSLLFPTQTNLQVIKNPHMPRSKV
jgi:hypothetical protein